MAQTASALSTEQSLYITQDESLSGFSSESKITVDHELEFVNAPAVFSYGDRSRFRFDISAGHASHFALIRGLIEFNRPKELNFVFHSETKSFETDIESSHREQLDTLIPLVNTLLLKELRFKNKLKEVIRFEAHYRKEKEKVYSSFL